MTVFQSSRLKRAIEIAIRRMRIRKNDNSFRRLVTEPLEARTLLAGLVMNQSTFSLENFEANLVEQVGPTFDFSTPSPNVIGYSYAMSQRNPADPFTDPKLLEGAGGYARVGFWDIPSDFPVLAAPDKRQEVASISKTITASAILHLLQEQTSSIAQIEALLDTSISFFVPSNWTTTSAFDSITIRELLNHTSGVRNNAVGDYIYSALQNFAQTGTLAAKTPVYSTYNYSFFRVMLPYMWNEINLLELGSNATTNQLDLTNVSPNPAINLALAFSILEDWNPPVSNNIATITPDRVTATIYKYYVATYILEPSGIVDPTTRTPPDPLLTGDHTLVYYLNVPSPGFDTGDLRLDAGSRSWNMSAREVEQFLSGIRFDDSILEPATRDLMDEQFLGWRGPGTTSNFTGDFGDYLGHDGVNFSPPASSPGLFVGVLLDPLGRTWRNNTQAMVFPNGVQASLLVSSQLGLQFGSSFNPQNAPNQPDTTMIQAYDHAWTDLVFEGNPGIFAGNDTIVLQANPINSDYIDLVHTPAGGASTTIFTRRHDTLDSLTINGLGGADLLTLRNLPWDLDLEITFNGGAGDDSMMIENLPAGVEVVFNGASGDDLLHIADTTRDLDNILGSLTFDGGTETNDLIVDDRNDFILLKTDDPNNKVRTYNVSPMTVARSGVGTVVTYSNIATVTLQSSDQSNQINVLGTSVGSDVVIEAGIGQDLIMLGTGTAASQLNSSIEVLPGGGQDNLVIDDRNSLVANENYVVFADYMQSQNIPIISWDLTSPPEQIWLRQNGVGTTTNVRDLLPGVRLEVEGNGGNDIIRVHETQPGSTLVVGGGAGDDQIFLAPESRYLDDIQDNVVAYGGIGSDRVILYDEDNSDVDGRHYRVLGRSLYVMGSSFGRLLVPQKSAMEFVEVRAGNEDDLFDARSWDDTAELQFYGNGGSDELRVALAARTVDSIIGNISFFADTDLLPGSQSPDDDSVIIADEFRTGKANYLFQVNDLQTQLTTTGFYLNSYGVEISQLNASNTRNLVTVSGSASILHKPDLILNLGGGDDQADVFAPASATVYANGGTGQDLARLFSTHGDDFVSLRGDRLETSPVMTITTTTLIRDTAIDSLTLDANGGIDLLSIMGVVDVNEQITVQASSIPGSGSAVAAPHQPLNFVELEEVTVTGNSHGSDRLDFRATNQDDSIIVNPVAAGTSLQPFVQLNSSTGSTLLKLRDAILVGVPTISGLAGSDTFRVSIPPNPSGYPIRDVRLEAGESPLDHDILIVNYNAGSWPLTQPATNPNNGTLRFGLSPNDLEIIFRDFEELIGDLF